MDMDRKSDCQGAATYYHVNHPHITETAGRFRGSFRWFRIDAWGSGWQNALHAIGSHTHYHDYQWRWGIRSRQGDL